MLRNIVIGLGVLLLGGGTVAALAGVAPGFPCLIFGALLLLGTLCERVFYKKLTSAPPEPGWVRTGERFLDDKTGKPVTVYIEPGTGERAYVQD